MRQKTVITKLFQSVVKVYYKARHVLQNESCIRKCEENCQPQWLADGENYKKALDKTP